MQFKDVVLGGLQSCYGWKLNEVDLHFAYFCDWKSVWHASYIYCAHLTSDLRKKITWVVKTGQMNQFGQFVFIWLFNSRSWWYRNQQCVIKPWSIARAWIIFTRLNVACGQYLALMNYISLYFGIFSFSHNTHLFSHLTRSHWNGNLSKTKSFKSLGLTICWHSNIKSINI